MGPSSYGLVLLSVAYIYLILYLGSAEGRYTQELQSSNASRLVTASPGKCGTSKLPLLFPSAGGVLSYFNETPASRILIFPPIIFNSHLQIFQRLAAGLAKAGHHPTLFVSDRRTVEERPTDYTLRRYPGIFSSEEGHTFLQNTLTKLLSGSNSLIQLARVLQHYMYNCDAIFSKGQSSLEELRRVSFDLIIVDANELCGFLLAKELNVPHVVFSTGMWVPYMASPAAPTSYVPEFNSMLSDRMSFFNRAKNVALRIGGYLLTDLLIYPLYNFLLIKHHIGQAPDQKTLLPSTSIARIIKDSRAWLLCTDTALEFPSPILPNVEYVGGILARPSQPLSKEFRDFVEESAKYGGFIAVSFGAETRRLTPRLETIFSRVLSQLPFRVLWRYNVNASLPLGENVKLVDWFPQNDLLAHPHIRAFVGHGGTNGVYECLYHAVPVVGIPLFGDQYDSMVRVEAKGMGLFLNWKTMTEEQLRDAICRVTSDPRYKQSMRYYSSVHRDTLLPPVERAVHRINYTLRYNGAPHLQPAIHRLSVLEAFQLDILIAVCVTIALSVWGFKHLRRRRLYSL